MLLYFLQRLTAMRKCRNWQTSKTKDLVIAISCGFKSHLPQEILKALSFQGFFFLSENYLSFGISGYRRIYKNQTAAIKNQRHDMRRCGYFAGVKRFFMAAVCVCV